MEMSKAVKRQMNEVVGKGYEEALRRALQKLDADFDLWRKAKIDSFELTERIHKFHQNENRDIYNRFSYPPRMADRIAFRCLEEGLVKEEDVPQEALAYLNQVRAEHQAYRERTSPPAAGSSSSE